MMTLDARQKLKGLLTIHESYKQFPYADTTGHLTIGIGRNLSTNGVSLAESLYLCDQDISYFDDKLSAYLPCYLSLDENRRIALVNMCFNLGIQGFLNFKEMLSALESGDYHRASKEMLESKWATQVGERALQLANIMRTGEL